MGEFMVQCSELKSDHLSLSYQKADLYLYDNDKTTKKAGEAFFGQSNFCKHHKEDKGNSSVSVYTLYPLPLSTILCIIVYCVASCQRNCQLTLFCSPFERRNK